MPIPVRIGSVTEVGQYTTTGVSVGVLAAFVTALSEYRVIVVEAQTPLVSAAAYSSGEVGDVATTTVVIVFTDTISSPANDYTLGVTIKVNGSAITVSSAALQSGNTTVRYVVTPAVDANDTITYEYSSGAGDLQDSAGTDLDTITATSVTNNVGTHWYFDVADDSAHLAGE